MGNAKKQQTRSRRNFFSLLFSTDEKPEMVKMLTPDGKLVEVEKRVLEAASKNSKASNKDIYNWMQNPSKNNK